MSNKPKAGTFICTVICTCIKYTTLVSNTTHSKKKTQHVNKQGDIVWKVKCRRVRNLRGISKHYVCRHLQQSRLDNDIIIYVSKTENISSTNMHNIWSYLKSRSNSFIHSLKKNNNLHTFCGTCQAKTRWVQSLSPASWWVYSVHTNSALMCRRLAHRWEP